MNKVKTCAAGFTEDRIREYICYECWFKHVCGIYKEMLRNKIERLQREHDANPAQPATLREKP